MNITVWVLLMLWQQELPKDADVRTQAAYSVHATKDECARKRADFLRAKKKAPNYIAAAATCAPATINTSLQQGGSK